MSLTLNPKEQQMLAAFLSLVPEMPKIDWDVAAPLMGHKYARNAKPAFTKIWEKLKGGDGSVAGGNEANGADEIKPAATPTKAAKKGVGLSTTPRKAAAGGPKTPRKSKKQKEAEKSEESIREEDENGNNSSGADINEAPLVVEEDVGMLDLDEA